jgi:hypothetical protein
MKKRMMAAAVLSVSWAVAGVAQERPGGSVAAEKSAQSSQPTAAAVSLRVTIVISRHQGDKRISSLPYAFGVTSGDRTNLRMGSEVPIVSRAPKGGELLPASISYRPVGTNIDCGTDRGVNGMFRMVLTIEDSSVHLDSGQKGAPVNPAMVNDYPSFRSFKLSFVTVLRDGQTVQHTSATDPVTGEVMKVDVSLNVLK